MNQRTSYTLDDLIAQCDPDAPVPQDMIDWEDVAPVGLEQTVMGIQVDIQEAILKFQELLSDDVILLVLFGSRAGVCMSVPGPPRVGSSTSGIQSPPPPAVMFMTMSVSAARTRSITSR